MWLELRINEAKLIWIKYEKKSAIKIKFKRTKRWKVKLKKIYLR